MNPFIEPSSRLACLGLRRRFRPSTGRILPDAPSTEKEQSLRRPCNIDQQRASASPKGVKMYRHALMGSCSVLFVSFGSLAALSTVFLAQGAPQKPGPQSESAEGSGERAKPSFLVLPYLQMPTPTGITVM